MFDETTDCSVIEQLVIRTRFIDSDGVLKVKFLKMLDVLKPAAQEDRMHNQTISLNATNIANQVKDFVQAIDVFEVSWHRDGRCSCHDWKT